MKTNHFLFSIPMFAWVVAVLAGSLHLAPVWRAQLQTPPGWTFTGNVNSSPDYMQYRVWMRQTQETGVLVANKFTTEPNKPHLPVVFYYIVGQVSRWMNISPEFVYAYLGALFAFVLTILLFVSVRHFLKSTSQVYWVFLIVLIGGGLGAHLKLLASFDAIKGNPILRHTIVEGLSSWLTFEDYRSHYVFITLFDTHMLLVWITTSISVLSLYLALQRFSVWRGLLMMILYLTTTLLHFYEGITLIGITLAVAGLFWRKGLLERFRIVIFLAGIIAVSGCLMWMFFLYQSSGFPFSSWRAVNILFSTLLISYPLAWLMIGRGLAVYWREAHFNECFLLGWALGCVALTLSGPFYPYPDRGTMTLQIPIYIIAGCIFFSRHKRFTPVIVILVFLVLGATPMYAMYVTWRSTKFDTNMPSTFMSPAHKEIVNILRERSSEDDVLILNKADLPWKTDDLWLAPDYPGRFYCSHFFLTVDYERKRSEIISFFESKNVKEQATFLRERKSRFLYVEAKQIPNRFEKIPGLILLKSTPFGSLFEYKNEVEGSQK